MRVATVCLLVGALWCGALAGVARRDVQQLQPDSDGAQLLSAHIQVQGADEDAVVEGLVLPERDARGFLGDFSPINQVTEYVRRVLPRDNVLRPMAQRVMGVVQGREGCWQKTLCEAGKMLAGFRQTRDLFNMIEKYSPAPIRDAVEIMKRGAVEGDDCATLICNV